MRHAQIKAFLAVARSASFSRAAEHLGLTQPAVSDHVRKLEQQYGVELFRRAPEGASLTAIGRKLFAIAERQFEAEGQAIELLSRARSLAEGQLTLGADAAIHALPLVARFRERFPGIEIRIVTGNSFRLIELLRDFSIDVAICAERPKTSDILSQRIASSRLVAAAPVAPSDERARLKIAEFAAGPVILREEGSTTRSMLSAELQARGLRLKQSIEVESREAALEAVAEGLGLMIMPENELPDSRRVQAIPISDWKATMDEWLLVLSERSGLYVIEEFIALAGLKRPQ
jgi:aminoethylphosphonate catabolism LysR family transcriptional regulator